MTRWMLALVGAFFLGACGSGEQAQQTLPMPHKEKTWVKTEKVETTREAALNKPDPSGPNVSVDAEFKKVLLIPAADPHGAVTDSDTCLAALRPLDEKRMLLQRAGGLWHAFEQAPPVRPYSDRGMQLDSNLNKLVQALRHLCKTAEGVPLSPLARRVSNLIEEKGKEGARQYLLDQGRAPKDIEIWFQYTESAQHARTRQVPYASVEALIRKTRPLLDAYESLYQMEVTAASQQQFLTQAVTLLEVLHERLENEPELVVAMKEDSAEPLVKFEGEM